MSETELVVSSFALLDPVRNLQQAIEAKQFFQRFVASQLTAKIDYDPAVGDRLPSLKQPGAQKLASIYGLSPKTSIDTEVVDWTGEDHGGEPICAYTITCSLWRGNIYMGQATGHCNSRESKYRYRWMGAEQLPAGFDVSKCMRRTTMIEEYGFAIEQAKTTGEYGKPVEYWEQFKTAIANKTAEAIEKKTNSGRAFVAYRIMGTQFRVPNPDIFDIFNTVLKIAMKRAFVGAVIVVTNASDLFTQDLEGDELGHFTPPPTPPPQDDYTPPPPRAQQTQTPPPPRPQPPPPPPRDEPAAVAELRAKMPGMSREQRLQVFAGYKRDLASFLGEDKGGEVYYGVLRDRHHVEHASQFQSLAKAIACIVDLDAVLTQAKGETVVEEEPAQ